MNITKMFQLYIIGSISGTLTYIGSIFMVNAGKHTSPIDRLGYDIVQPHLSGVIIVPTQTMHYYMREIPQNYESHGFFRYWYCWWFRNPANQLRFGSLSHVYPCFIHPTGGWRWDFWTISWPPAFSGLDVCFHLRLLGLQKLLKKSWWSHGRTACEDFQGNGPPEKR